METTSNKSHFGAENPSYRHVPEGHCLVTTSKASVSVGSRFGLLTILTFVGYTPVYRKHVWLASCECGREVVVKSQELLNGDTRSCGCLHRAAVVARNRENAKHRKHGTTEYRSWRSAKDRCFNPRSKDARNYSARGISMCDRWRYSFEAFFEDMGTKPAGFSLERIDNNGDYEPGNCRWADVKSQGNNRRTSRKLELDGEVRTITEWAEYAGMKDCTLRVRLFKQGLTLREALNKPVRPRRNNEHTGK